MRKRALVLAATGGLALAGGAVVWRAIDREPPPAPPLLVDASAVDRDIASLIARTVDEVRARPRDAALRTKLAYVYHANGFRELAAQAYQHALERAPRDAVLWHNFALLKLEQRDAAAARDALEQSIQLDDAYAPSHWRLGFVLLDEGAEAEAERAFARAAALDPKDAAAQVGLARAMIQTDRPREAVDLLQKLLASEPPNADYVMGLLATASRRAGLETGDAPLPAGPSEEPVWPDARLDAVMQHREGYVVAIQTAEQLIEAGRYGEAAGVVQRVLSQRLGDVTALNYLAQAQLASGEVEGAIRTLLQAIAKDRDHAMTHYNLADAYLRKDDLERTTQHVSRAIEINPVFGQAHALLGQVHVKRNELPQAEAELKRALELGGAGEQAQLLLGGVYLAQRRWSEADGAFGRLIQRFPKSATGYVGLARARAELGALDDAVTLLQQAHQIDPNAPALVQTAQRVRQLRESAGITGQR